jgi:hypothetical protein
MLEPGKEMIFSFLNNLYTWAIDGIGMVENVELYQCFAKSQIHGGAAPWWNCVDLQFWSCFFRVGALPNTPIRPIPAEFCICIASASANRVDSQRRDKGPLLQNNSYSSGVAQSRHPSSQAVGSYWGGEGLPRHRMLPGGWTGASREWRQPSRATVVMPVEPPARAAGRSREFTVGSHRWSSREFTLAGARESLSSLRGHAAELEHRRHRRSLLRLAPTIPFFLGDATVWIPLPEPDRPQILRRHRTSNPILSGGHPLPPLPLFKQAAAGVPQAGGGGPSLR